MSDLVAIPWQELTQDALNGVVEEFVTRDGTDYGAEEIPLQQKRDQVMAGIKTGLFVIVFDSELSQVHIVTKEDWQQNESGFD